LDVFISKTLLNSFASRPATVESLLILILSLYYLFEQINNTDTIFIYSKKTFWVVASLIIYISGTFFLFIFAQKMLNDPVFLNQYTIMNSLLYITRNILITIGLVIKETN
jgi:hypothetical protein